MEAQESKNIGLNQLRKVKEDTINKWEKLGLLEGLVAHDDSKNIAQLFECCPTYKINEEETKLELFEGLEYNDETIISKDKPMLNDLDLLNKFLNEIAKANIGVRRKIVIIENFLKKLKQS